MTKYMIEEDIIIETPVSYNGLKKQLNIKLNKLSLPNGDYLELSKKVIKGKKHIIITKYTKKSLITIEEG